MAFFNRPLVIWAALVALTLASVAIAELIPLRVATYVVVFAAAVVKGQMVAVHFMETPRSQPVWNALYRIWIAAIGIALCAGVAFAH